MVENSENPGQTPPENEKISGIDNLTSFLRRAWAFAKLTIFKVGHIETANMEMGIRQMKRGEFMDAGLRFKFVLWMNKRNVIAYYLLGKTYFYRGKLNEAAPRFAEALRLQPDFEEAKFLLACCGQGPEVRFIPRSFIIEKLDYIAESYEAFVENTSSKVNIILAEEFAHFMGDKMAFNVLDLGCRGGDSAQVLRGRANSITGVEPSLKLVAIARNRRVNDLLSLNTIITKFPEDYARESQETFPVVMTTFYLDNLGPLDEYFANISRLIEKGGFFAFNINRHMGGQDYFFKAAAMTFAHSPKYIDGLLTKSGLKILGTREVSYPSGSVDIVYMTEKL